MHLVMFDIDGTLVDTAGFEDHCYGSAVKTVVNGDIPTDWSGYAHATDSGILDEILETRGLAPEREAIHHRVRTLFARKINAYLKKNTAREIPGAANFLRLLKTRGDVVLAIATGGWEETAKMKLDAAGIDYAGIAFASASDAVSRSDIMLLAERRAAKARLLSSRSYFGDAVWDQKTCRKLDYNFILVGDRLENPKKISDYTDQAAALAMIGLE